MFADRRPETASLADLERIEALVRARFSVPESDLVLVSEDPGRAPGLPTRMTTVLFWIGRDRRHRLRVFRAAADVGGDDLPPGWLRGALLDEGEGDCC